MGIIQRHLLVSFSQRTVFFSHSVDVLLRLMPRYLIKNLSILAGDWTYGSDRFCILRRVCESSSITQPYCHLNMVSQLMDAIAVVVFWGHILPLPECLALQNYKNVNLSKLNPKNVLITVEVLSVPGSASYSLPRVKEILMVLRDVMVVTV